MDGLREIFHPACNMLNVISFVIFTMKNSKLFVHAWEACRLAYDLKVKFLAAGVFPNQSNVNAFKVFVTAQLFGDERCLKSSSIAIEIPSKIACLGSQWW